MIRKRRHISGWALSSIIVCAISLIALVYIMANGLGLQEELDFGAGAYYYADIPDFEKYLAWDAFSTTLPYLLYLAIFFVWGFIVYKFWVWVDKRKK